LKNLNQIFDGTKLLQFSQEKNKKKKIDNGAFLWRAHLYNRPYHVNSNPIALFLFEKFKNVRKASLKS
jgi:hypothetical protein